jgi:hypothetical protein
MVKVTITGELGNVSCVELDNEVVLRARQEGWDIISETIEVLREFADDGETFNATVVHVPDEVPVKH